MTTCAQCGAAAEAYAPCPRCGELVEPRGSVDIDSAAVGRGAQAGTGDRPTDAQIGGSAGAGPLGGEQIPRPRPGVHQHALEDAQREIARDGDRTRALWWRLVHVPLWCVLAFLTASYVALDSAGLVVNHVNDWLHLAGNAALNWGGEGQRALGGTLGQVLVPVALAAYLYYRLSDRFWATAALWWVGQSLTHVAAYMRDADLILREPLAGDVHAWRFLFARWDALDRAAGVAGAVGTAGLGIMAVTLAVLGWLAWRPDRYELVA